MKKLAESAAGNHAALAQLWARLQALDLDGGASLSFSRRLARDNGWPVDFAHRVVLEYKKFLFLAATCGHPVTPSDEVDQAWHLHLVYTRSYWDELCGQVLGFPLHHGPTRGGAAEGQKFEDWYARTLNSYTAAFGTLPPADIWPEAAVRFGEAPHFRRINLRKHWLLPRPRWPFRRPNGRVELGLLAMLGLLGCGARTPLNPLNWYGPEFLTLFWGLALLLVPVVWWLRRAGRGPETDYAGAPLGTYELVRLSGRGQLVAENAIAALVSTGHAELMSGRQIRRTDAAPPAEPYERTVWDLIRPDGSTELDALLKQAANPNVAALQALDAALEAKGLLLPPARRKQLNRIPLLAALGLSLFGLAKIGVGLHRDRPVGLLCASLLVLAVLAWSYRTAAEAWATGCGTRLLQRFIPEVRADQVAQRRSGGPVSGHLVAVSVAFFGVAELRRWGMGAVAASLAPPPSSDSGDSGGSGCGSSGCEGGCGGCGGCGS
ncbi:TIGR04222 domain-containing membrane protein [Hymenobacter properus]|uniref:TIGR04222 domain-containing membrane protein n=1 Tax=Hymenobacter properus TaxID=2791026 RepID=A0A931BJ37_9BACT|nr:TIGR04222 domain-containing membrane protein [Hymenobacter properus]MBF9141138.1 TIGR04222 domain-containing membrane protein [Hymenobacter properus]MBR7719947.1 TIGR04222 domain-containing membrane protein [Microvirga sp. SRT04]